MLAQKMKTPKGKMAHFFEHLLFDSENIQGVNLMIILKIQAEQIMHTSNDKTYCHELLPSNQLELGLWLESERMLHAKVEPIGIETQEKL